MWSFGSDLKSLNVFQGTKTVLVLHFPNKIDAQICSFLLLLFIIVKYHVPCRDGDFNEGMLLGVWSRVSFMGWLLREAILAGGDTHFLKCLLSFLISVSRLGVHFGSLFLESQRTALPKNSLLYKL